MKSTRYLEAAKIFWITVAKRWRFKERFFPQGTTAKDLYDDAAINVVPPEAEKLSVTWLGHATTLIQMRGLNVLTDPVFGHLSFMYPRMIRPIDVKTLPRIDVVLISHNHRDHCDLTSLAAIVKHWPNVRIFLPNGDRAVAARAGANNISEFSWGKKTSVEDVSFAFLPSKHWSARGLTDGNSSMWGSWMVISPQATVYFSGDSGFSSALYSSIGKDYPSIDLALLPVGPVNPRALMEATHMSPDEVIRAFELLGAKRLIPIHWGTFPLGPDTALDAIGPLRAWARRDAALLEKDGRCFQELRFGGRFSLHGTQTVGTNLV